MLDDGNDFSFSGLKTAVVLYVRKHPEVEVADVAASFQAAVVDVLVSKLLRVAAQTGISTVVIGGGVAANSGLRARLVAEGARRDLRVVLPSVGLCTDNAAMVASVAWWRLAADGPTSLADGAYPSSAHRLGAACPGVRRLGTVSTRHAGVLIPAVRLDPQSSRGSLEEDVPMNLQPLEDRIVVRPAEAEETTISGLVIPDTAKEKPQQGEVLAVGPGRRAENTGELIAVDLSVGDTVVYSKYGGTEITIDGEDVLILSSRDVLAKVGAKAKKK